MSTNERPLSEDQTMLERLMSLARLASDIKAGLDDMIAAEREQRSGASVVPNLADIDDAAFVRSMLQARRLRNRYIRSEELFGEPAWDMLLELLASRLEDRQVNVSSLCMAAAAPASTALRWIGRLIEIGLVEKVGDPSDGRRFFVGLTDEGYSRVTGYLAGLRDFLART